MPAIDRRRRLALLVGLTLGLAARAEEGDRVQVRLRGGLALHSGAEADLGPGLAYGGPSGNDLLLAGWVWPFLDRQLGLAAEAGHEGFSLLQGDAALTQASLWRVAVGPAGRLLLGPVRLALAVSWAFDQLPVFGTVGTPTFRAAARHAIRPAARAELDLGPVTLEAFLDAPLGLAVQGISAGASWGLAAGGGARVTVLRTGALEWGLLLEASWTRDALSGEDLESSRAVVRVSGALDLRWREPPAPPPPARLVVYAARGEEVAAGLEVLVHTAAGEARLVCDGAGEATLEPVPPGLVEVAAGGPEAGDARARGEAVAGELLRLELRLPRPAPRVGALVVRVQGADGEALPGAQVSAGGQTAVSGEDGQVRLEGLPPGTLAVAVKAAGLLPADDAVTVVPGQATALEVTLRPPARRLPAVLKGLIRSARGGEPVRARLEVKERRLVLEADGAGAFSAALPGGTYTVRIAAPGFRPQVKVVAVKDGDQVILNVDLSPR